jgi:hypothetical protein
LHEAVAQRLLAFGVDQILDVSISMGSRSSGRSRRTDFA